MFLSAPKADVIAARIADIETRTGVQEVVAIVGRAARYPDVRWKAFALGVSIGALLVGGFGIARPGWNTASSALGGIVLILAAGITKALIATWVRRY